MKSPDCYHLNTQHAPENTLTGTNRGPDTCESSHTRSSEQTHNLTVNSNLSDNCQLRNCSSSGGHTRLVTIASQSPCPTLKAATKTCLASKRLNVSESRCCLLHKTEFPWIATTSNWELWINSSGALMRPLTAFRLIYYSKDSTVEGLFWLKNTSKLYPCC